MSDLLNNTNIIIGLASLTGASLFAYYLFRSRAGIDKKSILDYVGNTPLIFLPRLSAAAGAEIYVS